MRFTKMHGAGNDYVYIDCFAEPFPERPEELARQVSDRHFGIGGDGLVLICPSDVADAKMRMFNADGSEAQMCGNAIRCVAKYVYDHGLAVTDKLTVETPVGVLSLELEVVNGTVRRVRVDMGRPVLRAADIPTTFTGEQIVNAPLVVGGCTLEVTCVSMGNPHCVTYVDRLSDEWVRGLGPIIEHDAHFPERVNAEFVEVLTSNEVRVRVWERGSGETLACGTGAAAVCVAGVLTGRTGRRLTVALPGGTLELMWAEDEHVYKTGPAVEVFTGQWNTEHAVSR